MPSFNSLILFYPDTSGRLLRERIRKTTANMEKYSYRKSRERWNSAEKTRQRRAVKIKPQISVTDIACERSGAERERPRSRSALRPISVTPTLRSR